MDIEAYLLKDASEEAMIERREELSDVKCKSAGSVILDLLQMYDMSKSDTCISSGFKFQTF